MQVTIDSLGSSGEGVGHLPDGMVVFIPGALVGELVEITLTRKKKSYALGNLEKILHPSPDRITPICPLFGSCGGCHIMHLDYDASLEMKRQKVQDALERIAHLKNVTVSPPLPSPMPLHYRNKIALPVTEEKIGLYKRGSHEIIDVPKCYIHCESGEEIYHWIRRHLPRQELRALFIRSAIRKEETLVIFVTKRPSSLAPFAHKIREKFPRVVGVVENINSSSGNALLSSHFITLSGRDHYFEKIADKTFKISAGSFFQINSWQAEVLFQKAIDYAEISPHETVLDAYMGVGTLALFAADHAKKVLGTECFPEAVAAAKENARLNQITNCEFSVANARALPADITFLNPPRKGCDPEILKHLFSQKLIYISCNPATLARDLTYLPHYRIEHVQPIDLFPQTMHIETLVSLRILK